MQSSPPKRRFPPPWTVESTQHGYIVKDANGRRIAWIYHREDLHKIKWGDYYQHLTADDRPRATVV